MNETWWLEEADLDKYQKKIYGLPLDGSYLITGPPGSGKTNLLLLRAKYLIRSKKKNIMILVFNNTLKNFLNSGGESYEIDGVEMKTIAKFIRDILYQNDLKQIETGDFEKDRLENANLLEEYISENKIVNLYKVILIDEAQDCLPIEARIIKRLGERLFAVADSRQKIYSGGDPFQELEKNVEVFTLKFHYRNGRNICILADGIAKYTEDYQELTNSSNYDESSNPSKVELIECKSIDEQLQRIESQLDIQLKTYPNEFIGIICPTNDELRIIEEYFENSVYKDRIANASIGNGYLKFDFKTPIIICNIHNSKGLEFRAVHIACFDSLKKYKKLNRNLTYTAVTRAKTSLNIYHCGNLYGYFVDAFEQINPIPYKPTVEDIFGKKKN